MEKTKIHGVIILGDTIYFTFKSWRLARGDKVKFGFLYPGFLLAKS